jgi:hypothetical protein
MLPPRANPILITGQDVVVCSGRVYPSHQPSLPSSTHLVDPFCDTIATFIVFLSEFFSNECLLTVPLFDLSRFMHVHGPRASSSASHTTFQYHLWPFNIMRFPSGTSFSTEARSSISADCPFRITPLPCRYLFVFPLKRKNRNAVSAFSPEISATIQG